MRQKKRENRSSVFQVVVCVRQRERREKVDFKLWFAPDKVREEKECVSGRGVCQIKRENRNSEFQAVVCARQRERTEIVGFSLWREPDKRRKQKYWFFSERSRIMRFRLLCAQTIGERRNNEFQAILCTRQRERTETVVVRMWFEPDKMRE